MQLGQRIADRFRAGQPVSDAEFDALYATEWQLPSSRYWTPVDVALRAAEWLTAGGARRVLDVGAGAGKVCLIGALASEAHFFGIEQRPRLVGAAREAARRLGVCNRATFLEGDVSDVELASYDALYCFNPFGENLYSDAERLDGTVELSEGRYHRDLERVERALEERPLGARLVTYHGYGGRIPDTFELLHLENRGTDVLRAWVKARPASERQSFLVEPALCKRPHRS
jgi:predicted RNA methylase